MKLRAVGFFRELDHGLPHGSSLRGSMRDVPQPDEDKVISYLKNGVLFIFCPGVVSDVISGSRQVICAPHVLTDGAWAWPNDLSFYVEKYHVALPPEFTLRMKGNGWRVPEIPHERLKEMEIEAFPGGDV